MIRLVNGRQHAEAKVFNWADWCCILMTTEGILRISLLSVLDSTNHSGSAICRPTSQYIPGLQGPALLEESTSTATILDTVVERGRVAKARYPLRGPDFGPICQLSDRIHYAGVD
jgi:hypothetical protein